MSSWRRILIQSEDLFDSELPELLIDGAGIEFTGDVWRSLCHPCVYVAANEERVLYVGLSQNGLARPFSRGHHKLRSSFHMHEVESLKVYPCRSIEAARAAERILIATLNPQWNDRQTLSSRYRNKIDALIQVVQTGQVGQENTPRPKYIKKSKLVQFKKATEY